MGLRNIIFIISCIIVGLCLSLYFQNEQQIQSVNYDQYKNLQYNEERSHSLEDFNQKILPYRLEDFIEDIYEKNRLMGEKTRVMEIGAGNGRVLMELKKKFPEVEFYGINKDKTHTFYRRESYALTALKFEIFNQAEIEDMVLPYIVFQDLDFGAKIPYDNDKFDVIFSQGTLPYIKYKFELFNEIMRVLRKGGVSFHADVTGVNLYSKGLVVDLKDGMAEIRKQGIEIQVLENDTSIKFVKPNHEVTFPVTPHQAVPKDLKNVSQELRKPEMGYNIN